MDSRHIVLALAGMLLGSIPCGPAMTEGAADRETGAWAAKVNGDPVAAAFFERRLTRNRASAYLHFGQKYGATDSADFWTTAYEGVTPLAWLRKKTLDECARITVELALAREKGLLADTTYEAFLARLERENQRRREALAAGEPIYGPQQYREDEHFQYFLSNLRIEVQRRLGQQELRASDEDLRAHYERNKQSYDRGYRVRLWVIEIPFERPGEPLDQLSREAARAKMVEAKARLDKGESFEVVAAAYDPGGSHHEWVMDEESARMDERAHPTLRQLAAKLAPGEVTGIFEERKSFVIAKCVEKEALGSMPFEEVKPNVERRLIDERYEALVAELIGKAKVEVNQSVYEAARVR